MTGWRTKWNAFAQGLPFSHVFFMHLNTKLILSTGSYPGNRRWSGLQDGTRLTVDQTQFDKTTHGLRKALWDRTQDTNVTVRNQVQVNNIFFMSLSIKLFKIFYLNYFQFEFYWIYKDTHLQWWTFLSPDCRFSEWFSPFLNVKILLENLDVLPMTTTHLYNRRYL